MTLKEVGNFILQTLCVSKSHLNWLNHSFPVHPFPIPCNIKIPPGFLMFSGCRERVDWEQMVNSKSDNQTVETIKKVIFQYINLFLCTT